MTTIAVLGGGYAGLRTVKRLVHEKVDARIVLINNNPYHYESTQLHEIVAGTKVPCDITFDIRQAVSNKVEVIIDTVTAVDREHKKVELADSEPISYDYLVNALGFESETFGIPGAEENSMAFTNIETAVAVHDHIERTLAHYATSHDENDLRIVVCGAGFTGVELLGELLHQIPMWNKKYSLPQHGIKLICVEVDTQVLRMLPKELADWAVDYLTKGGVDFHLGTGITEVKPNLLVCGEQEFPANTIIWTTGVRGSHVISESGYDQKRNRVVVQADLSLQQFPEEYLIGDVSAVPDPTSGRVYPTTAQIAVAQADVVATNIAAVIAGNQTKEFVYKSVGTVCSLGPFAGVASIEMFGHWKLKGHVVGIVKKLVNDRSVLELANMKEMLTSD